jgi:hypothetical protein
MTMIDDVELEFTRALDRANKPLLKRQETLQKQRGDLLADLDEVKGSIKGMQDAVALEDQPLDKYSELLSRKSEVESYIQLVEGGSRTLMRLMENRNALGVTLKKLKKADKDIANQRVICDREKVNGNRFSQGNIMHLGKLIGDGVELSRSWLVGCKAHSVSGAKLTEAVNDWVSHIEKLDVRGIAA